RVDAPQRGPVPEGPGGGRGRPPVQQQAGGFEGWAGGGSGVVECGSDGVVGYGSGGVVGAGPDRSGTHYSTTPIPHHSIAPTLHHSTPPPCPSLETAGLLLDRRPPPPPSRPFWHGPPLGCVNA